MTKFWKFNSLMGAVATVLVIVAYFVGNHKEVWHGCKYNISWELTEHSKYCIVVAVAFFAWQLLMTILGILVDFFRAWIWS